MVDVGPLAPSYCPNGQTCPHDILQHRYNPQEERWECTVQSCAESADREAWLLEAANSVAIRHFNFNQWCEQFRERWIAEYESGRHKTVILAPAASELEETRRERRKRLNLRWWQREKP